MIVSLKGKIISLSISHLVLDVSGVGYESMISLGTYDHLISNNESEVSIQIYHHITDSSQSLFGFIDNHEKEIFKLLISVSGIGPKTAIQLLSSATASEMEEKIKSGEVSSLTSLPGIGPKTAKRIIIELKEKFVALDENDLPIEDIKTDNSIYNDALDALVVLGYSKKEITIQLNKIIVEQDISDTSELIRLVLKKIGAR